MESKLSFTVSYINAWPAIAGYSPGTPESTAGCAQVTPLSHPLSAPSEYNGAYSCLRSDTCSSCVRIVKSPSMASVCCHGDDTVFCSIAVTQRDSSLTPCISCTFTLSWSSYRTASAKLPDVQFWAGLSHFYDANGWNLCGDFT